MRRSNSSGWPVSSACTGASKPSVCADFGTSCTWPSVIMMTPASRSGGVLASALLRSANRLVPDAVSPVGLDEVTQRTCRLAMPASLALELAPDRRGLLGPAGDRLAQALVDDDDGDVGEALALLLPQRRVGRAPAAARPATGRAAGRRGCAGTAAAPPARPPAPRPPRTAAPAPSARNRSTSCSCCVIRRRRVLSREGGRARASLLQHATQAGVDSYLRGHDVVIGRAFPAAPARAPGRPCSCRSART